MAGSEGPFPTIPWILGLFFPRKQKLPSSLGPDGRDADATFTDKEVEVSRAPCSLSCSREALGVPRGWGDTGGLFLAAPVPG